MLSDHTAFPVAFFLWGDIQCLCGIKAFKILMWASWYDRFSNVCLKDNTYLYTQIYCLYTSFQTFTYLTMLDWWFNDWLNQHSIIVHLICLIAKLFECVIAKPKWNLSNDWTSLKKYYKLLYSCFHNPLISASLMM